MNTKPIGYVVVDEFGDIANFPPEGPSYDMCPTATEDSVEVAEEVKRDVEDCWAAYWATRHKRNPYVDLSEVEHTYRVAALVELSHYEELSELVSRYRDLFR